jgi:hypothetical protein
MAVLTLLQPLLLQGISEVLNEFAVLVAQIRSGWVIGCGLRRR